MSERQQIAQLVYKLYNSLPLEPKEEMFCEDIDRYIDRVIREVQGV